MDESCDAGDNPSYVDLVQRVNELEVMVARHQRTEAKLLHDGRNFRKLAEMLPEAVFESDTDANLTYLNQNGLHQLGYPGSKTVQQLSVFDLIITADQPQAREHFARVISDRETSCHTYAAIRKNGDTFPTLFLCTPLQEKDIIIGVRGFIRDVSTCREARQALAISHDELEQKAIKLEEANLALSVLLKQHEKNKNDLAEDVLENVESLIFPHLAKIKKSGLTLGQEALIDVLESDLHTLVSPFIRSLKTRFHRLTPMEIQVANLIKQGKTTKEIAGLLGVASSTIDTHRNHIRGKLQLKRPINLSTFLHTFK